MLKKNLRINMLKFFTLLISFSLSAADITVPVGGNIQEAINDVNSSGGGAVTLASGTHTITETLEMKSNVTFQGSGIYASTIKINTNKQIMAEDGYSSNKTNAVNNVLIQNITFIGINGDEGGVAITQQNTDNENITLLNVRCYNVGWGVHIKGAKNVLIENCEFSKNGALGKEGFAHNLYLRRVYGAVVKNSSFNYSTSANGINISYSEDIEIYGCEMVGNYFRGVRAADSDGYLVHDCVITDNGNVGLLANTENVVTKNIDWANNCVANNDVGMETKNGATGSIINCNSYGNGSNYKLVSSVYQSNNISDSSINCDSSVNPIDPVEPVTEFVPDTSKKYYIDSAYYNARLAATGESEDAYTTDESTTGSDVEWKFVAKGNGYWHIQRAAGGTKPRLRTDNSANADMQATGWSGTFTYYEITTGDITNSYFLTLADGPSNFNRLQINRSLDVKMVSSANHDGTWESFTITEAGTTTTGTDVRLEAEDYDSMSGIQTENSSESGDNVGWINDGDWLRFDDINLSGVSNMDARVSSKYSGGTIEVRTGSATGTLIGSIDVSNTGGDQNWITSNTSLSNASGTQDVYLVFTGGSGYLYNVNWIEFNTSSQSNKDIEDTNVISDVIIYPNPVEGSTTIQNAANTIMYVYDLNGSVIFTKSISADQETVDLGKLQPGTYFTEVVGLTKHSIVKLIKN